MSEMDMLVSISTRVGEMSGDVKAIKERLERGDELIGAIAKEQRELPCKQAVSSCPDNVKTGWGRPTAYAAGGGGIAAIIFGLIELAKQYLTTKGHL